MSIESSVSKVFVRSSVPFLIAASGFLGISCEATTQITNPPGVEDSLNNTLQMGDVVLIGREAFLLRNNKTYPVLDLERYKRVSKLEQYGRKILLTDRNILTQYPLTQITALPTDLGIIDPFTGMFKEPQQFGGEMNVFFGGFTTDEGDVYNTIKPSEDSFLEIRKALKNNKWRDLLDSLFFTYGEKNGDRYEAKNTARPPKENITFALEYFETLKELFPLTQFNLIGHSLGGVFALEVARKHPDAVNNLVLINSPIRGINKTFDRTIKTQLIRQYLKPTIGDEQATDYLFDLWDDKEYQKQLDKFTASFIKSGRGLITAISSDDMIVPPESAKIKGAKEIVISVGNFPIFEALKAHGRPLKSSEVTGFIALNLGVKITG